MSEIRLIDKEELRKKHPALDSKWRIEWLIRTGKIPVVRVGNGRGHLYFNEKSIEKWIEQNEISSNGEKT
ncbi:MAG: hypothetical protein ACM3SR_01630 [Ignavibacteriales bacterium]